MTPEYTIFPALRSIGVLYNDFHLRMTDTYEVEIKSLLGNENKAGLLRDAMRALDPSCKLLSKNKQLNHYFEGGALPILAVAAAPHLSSAAALRLEELSEKATDFSVRTRDKDGTVYLVVKATIGADSSANGVARMEFEEKVPLSLKQLDDLVLSAGFKYQAKWSREREEYLVQGTNVTLDKNAGYGWLAEFERIVEKADAVQEARATVAELMSALGVQELPQDRLERMFAFYNAHWPEYYGTDNIFIIE